jgi:hypothetical protein
MTQLKDTCDLGQHVYALLDVEDGRFTAEEVPLSQGALAQLQSRDLLGFEDGTYHVDQDLIDRARAHLRDSEHSTIWWRWIDQVDGSEGCMHGGVRNLDGSRFTCHTGECDARYDRAAARQALSQGVAADQPRGDGDG